MVAVAVRVVAAAAMMWVVVVAENDDDGGFARVERRYLRLVGSSCPPAPDATTEPHSSTRLPLRRS